MPESAILDEAMTLASGFAESKPAPQREEYELANESRVTHVVYPGPMMQMQVAIENEDRQYLVRGVFIVEFVHEGDVVHASSRGLPVVGVGRDANAALDNFCAAFDAQYRKLVDVSEDSLDETEKRGRRALLSVVDKVLSQLTPEVVLRSVINADEDDALELVYQRVDALLRANSFGEVDTLLAAVNVESLPPIVSLAFVSITRAARHALRGRADFVARVRRHFTKTDPERVTELLAGLE